MNTAFIKALSSLLFLLSRTSSSPIPVQPFLPGPCPKVSTMPDLDLSLYQGKWRQVGHGYRPDLLCVTSSYKLDEAGYLVTNTGMDTETVEEVIITAPLEHNQDDLSLHLDPSLDLPDEVYHVLATDYVSSSDFFVLPPLPLIRKLQTFFIGRTNVQKRKN
jgi:hypothetical protein